MVLGVTTTPNGIMSLKIKKKNMGYQKNENDGLFFMDYDSFLEDFRLVDIAQINDNASYVYKTLTDRQCKGVYFQINIKKSG